MPHVSQRSRALLLAAGLLASAAYVSPAWAGRPDVMIPVVASEDASVDAPGDVHSFGFLLTEDTATKVKILVKAAKKSALELDVRLIAPDGTEFDPNSVGKVKAKANKYVAKFTGVPQAGLWQLEIRGGNDSFGDFTVKLVAKEQQKSAGEEVVPFNQFVDVPLTVGEDQELTLKVKKGKGSSIAPNVEILDPNLNPLALGGLLVRNTKKGTAQLKNYRLPLFGTYVLRFRGEPQTGGGVKYKVITKRSKLAGDLPVADPGPGIEGEPGATVRLDGSASSGSNARSFLWTQISGDQVELSDPRSEFPTFTAPTRAGSLVFQLSVDDRGLLSHAVPLVVNIGLRPLADAGPVQRVAANSTVQLDGSGSLNRSARPLSFQWTQDPADANQVTLDDPRSATPTFTAPNTEGLLHFDLRVDDGEISAFTDRVTISVSATETAVADAGRDQFVGRMSTVHLSALRSLRPGGSLAGGLQWTQIAGPAVQLDDPTGPAPSFTAPKFTDDLAFRLTVDGDASTADEVSVFVREIETNLPPTVEASGPAPTAGGDVTLSSSSTDPNANARTSRWAQLSGPAATIADPTAEDPTVNIPAGSSLHQFGVQTNDGLQYSPLDRVTVTNTGFAAAPVAVAGPDRTRSPGQTVFLDGRGSFRTDGGTDPLAFTWTQVSGTDWYDVAAEDASFDPSAPNPTFVLPTALSSLTPLRSMSFALTVNDGTTDSEPDVVTFNFGGLPLNGVPSVSVSASTTNPIAGGFVQLTGTVVELDGDPVTQLWSQVSGPSVSFSPSRTVRNPTITAPTAGTIRLRFVASDPFDTSAPADIVLTVDQAPTAVVSISPDIADAGTEITVDGRNSSDPEGGNITYAWSQIEGPSVNFPSDAAVFTFDAPDAVVRFQLIVHDGRQTSSPAVGTFSSSLPPEANASASLTTAPYGASVTLRANPPANTNFDFTWRQINPNGTDPAVDLSGVNLNQENVTITIPLPTSSPFGGSNFGQQNASLPKVTFGVVAADGEENSAESTVTVQMFASLSDPNGQTNTSVMQIVSANCTSCHSGSNSSSSCGFGNNATFYGMSNKNAFRQNSINVNNSCSSGSRAVPGSPGSSSLYNRLNGQGGSMPPGNLMQTVDRNIISDWISQGCADN